MPRLALVTNTPPPYRVPIFQRLGNMPGVTFQAIFCAEREPNRQWDLPPLDFDHVFLRERFSTVNGRYIHNNPDVVPALNRFKPDVVITDGFNPTHLYAFAYAWIKGLPHVPMTDGTDVSERGLSALHKAVRRFIYARSSAFVYASLGGRCLYESYGVSPERCFQSCLCIDNDAFSPALEQQEKRFDFIFSGRIEPVKNPLFALQVALETARRLQRQTSILFVGAGGEEQKARSVAALQPELVQATFHGFAAQRELPSLYRSARLFLFPTLWDPWGVVANEACAAGLPVIVSPDAGVAGELVRDGENGFVCALDAQQWAERAALLLTRQDIWQSQSARSRSLARAYSYDSAAEGLLAACRFSLPAGVPDDIKNPI